MKLCDCCKREVDYARGSIWHGDDRICRECFIEWYDPKRDDRPIDWTSPKQIGNYVRRQHACHRYEKRAALNRLGTFQRPAHLWVCQNGPHIDYSAHLCHNHTTGP